MLTMTPIYQMEYQFNMITKDDLVNYVKMGILTKEGYKTILGVDYEEQATETN